MAVSSKPLAPSLIKDPGTGTLRSTVSSNCTRVESPSGVSVYRPNAYDTSTTLPMFSRAAGSLGVSGCRPARAMWFGEVRPAPRSAADPGRAGADPAAAVPAGLTGRRA